MTDQLHLTNDQLDVSIDPGRGADMLSIVHAATGIDLLFTTPWRARADAIRAGELRPATIDPVSQWMEQYRGGWQTLCPNAGPPREYLGVTLGFHGEASVVPWTVLDSGTAFAQLAVELVTVPLRIDREISLDGSSLSIIDTLTNMGAAELTIDYSNHPAFGGDFLADGVQVDTNATTFVPDPGVGGPTIECGNDASELRSLPAAGMSSSRFGWLTGFPGGGADAAWASVTNPRLGVRATLSWDPTYLPYAWWWQEFESSQQFPWFGRARVFAIEPASTQTSGPERASVMTIPARSSVRVPVRLTVKTEVESVIE